jgi:hypothetical protein
MPGTKKLRLFVIQATLVAFGFSALLRECFLSFRIGDRFTADFMLLARPCRYCGPPIPVARLVGSVGSAIGAAIAL